MWQISPGQLSNIAALGLRPDLAIPLSKGQPFFLHDFSRTDLTFQEATGQTPADDAGEAVALALEMGEIGDKTLAQMPESLPNSTWAGAVAGVIGAGGSLPTGWEVSASATTVAVNGLTTDSEGAPALDITIETVNGGGGSVSPRFRITPSIASAVGASWRATSKIEIVSLSSNNAVTPHNNVRCNVVEYDSGGFYVAETNSNDVNSVGIPTNTSSFRTLGTGPRSSFQFSVPTTVEAGKTVTLRLKISLPSFKKIPGYHAIQSGSTGARPLRQSDSSLKPDGLDDNLLSTLTASTSMFLAAAIKGGANPGSGVGAIIGGPIGTARGFLARDTSGRLCAGVGSDGTSTIFGGVDLAGLSGVAILNIDALGNVDLEWMPKDGSLTSLYSAPINGSVGAGTALRLWATNASGSAANYGSDYTYLATAQQAKWTAAERAQLAAYWNSRLP